MPTDLSNLYLDVNLTPSAARELLIQFRAIAEIMERTVKTLEITAGSGPGVAPSDDVDELRSKYVEAMGRLESIARAFGNVSALDHCTTLEEKAAFCVQMIRNSGRLCMDAERLMSLLARTWFYGDWKAETDNEKQIQKILTDYRWWPFWDEGQLNHREAERADSARRGVIVGRTNKAISEDTEDSGRSGTVDCHISAATSSNVLEEIRTERRYQIYKGHNAKSDDQQVNGKLTLGAIAKCYYVQRQETIARRLWPWTDNRRQTPFDGTERELLIQAAAMLVAEIERRDRADANGATL